MNIFKFKDILKNNKNCEKCGASGKKGYWVVNFKDETAIFSCEKCGFKKEVK